MGIDTSNINDIFYFFLQLFIFVMLLFLTRATFRKVFGLDFSFVDDILVPALRFLKKKFHQFIKYLSKTKVVRFIKYYIKGSYK